MSHRETAANTLFPTPTAPVFENGASDPLVSVSAGSVLVIDDDDDIREGIVEILREEGFDASGACDGLEGLEHLRHHQPGLILLDLMMPRMDGWEFRAHQLRDPRLAAIPVIVFSGVADARAAAEQLGTEGYLAKPVDLDRLLGIIEDLLARAAG